MLNKHKVFAVASTATLLVLGACASNPAYEKQQVLLNDPRMRCAQLELVRKGYNVDPSFSRPGRLLATRQLSEGAFQRAAITAAVDTTDNTFELWTRYIRPDETPVVTAPSPSGRMMLDAMEVENTCSVAR